MRIFIDLLPPAKKHDLQSGMIMAYAQTMVFVLFLVVVIISATLFSLKLILAAEHDYLQNQAKAAVSAESTDVAANIHQVNAFLATADVLQKRYIPWADVTKDIAALVPPETSLTRIRTDEANRIFIDGTAATRDESLAFIKALKEQAFITDVQSCQNNIPVIF